jgi:uncharacterized protein
MKVMQKKKFRIPRKKISEFCRRWGVVEFSLFGSALRADFRPDSDVDVLVTFSKEAEISLFDLVQMKLDLEKSSVALWILSRKTRWKIHSERRKS